MRRINSRDIILIEYDFSGRWLAQMPDENWLCVFVCDTWDEVCIDDSIAKIILKDVCWVVTVGKQCERIHDRVDETIVLREVLEKSYLPRHAIMTTWDHNFERGIWYSIIAANNDEPIIEKIVILDMTGGQRLAEIETALDKTESDSIQ